MSWVVTAIAGTTAVVGAVDANQKKQRNKGYISDAYQNSRQRLDLKHEYGRQDAAESLGARGLTSGGDVNASPIATAMVGGKMTAQGEAPHTLGAQVTSDNAVQMGLESTDLENQRGRSEQENNAQYTSSLIGSALNGVQMGVGAYGARQDLAAMKGMDTPAPSSAPPATIKGAYNIDPINPAPIVPPNATMGVGQPNYSFNRNG
jgi:hypothetical protein